MTGLRKLFVAMLVIAVGIALAAAPSAGAKKASLKLKSDSQSKILKKGVKVKVKGLKKGKLKVKAKSSTFDQQELLKFAKPKKVKAGKGKKTVRLRLTGKGKQRVATCEARKIVISAKHAGKAKAKLVRDTAECAPKPIDLSRAADCDFIGAQDDLAVPDAVPRRLLHGQGRVDAHRPAGRPARRRACRRTRTGRPIAAAPVQPQRRLQPRPGDHARASRASTHPQAFANTNPIPINELSRNESQDSNEPIVVIDADSGKRVPIWVELDSNATAAASTALLIHPATQFESGHRYIVAMRKLTRLEQREAARRRRASATTATTCRPTRRRSTTSASASRRSSAPCAR